MIYRVKSILSMDVEEVIASSHSLELLKIYSLLYLNGGQPRTCSRSQRAYFLELQTTGLDKAAKYNTIMERTNKPNWKGLRFIWGDHYSNETLTDEQAIKLLKNGGLRESDFEKLPEAYLNEPKPETWEQVKQTQPKIRKQKKG